MKQFKYVIRYSRHHFEAFYTPATDMEQAVRLARRELVKPGREKFELHSITEILPKAA